MNTYFFTQFLKGFFATTLILAFVGFTSATRYATQIDMGGKNISFSTDGDFETSFGNAVTSDMLVYKQYFDNLTDTGVSCSFVTISTSYCNEDYCYADKTTADKVCQLNSYDFASSYIYRPDFRVSAVRWSGSWKTTTSDMTYSAAPEGGGSLYVATGSEDTSIITYTYCCK